MKKLSDNLYLIEDFLSQSQCNAFIVQAEQQGFKPADVDLGKARAHMQHIRNNERVDCFDKSLAELWWQQLSGITLPIFEQRQAIGLSPYFRFYKYSPGEKFSMHKDGRQQIDGKQTLFTLLVYLNHDYHGGSTLFRQDDIEIQPLTGSALLFEHHLWHKGQKLLSGNKYVLRTDIIYQNP